MHTAILGRSVSLPVPGEFANPFVKSIHVSPDFAVNPNAKVQYTHLGAAGETLLIIDDFLLDPAAVVDMAAEGVTYGPAGAAYPGLRAPIPDVYNFNMYNALQGLLLDLFQVDPNWKMTLTSSFSMITERPATLKHKQRIPHVDQNDPRALAMVHYLCDPRYGGTAFFRQRSTGIQSVNLDTRELHNRALTEDINTRLMPAGFPDADHPFYEQIGEVKAQFNRLVCYQACILHSPAIARDSVFSPDPRQGRLTITAFLNPEDLIPLA